LLEGEAWGDFDVPTFEKFQMVERSCREVEIDCRVGVGRVVYPRSLNLLVYIPLWIILKEIEGTRLICAGK
jgi:hypothetical protein